MTYNTNPKRMSWNDTLGDIQQTFDKWGIRSWGWKCPISDNWTGRGVNHWGWYAGTPAQTAVTITFTHRKQGERSLTVSKYVLEAHEDCPRMSLERGSRWNQWVEADDNEEWQPSAVGIETIRTARVKDLRGVADFFREGAEARPNDADDAWRYALGAAIQRAKDRQITELHASMFSAPAERIRLNRRQRLRHWWREHRPHIHFGECKVEDKYD